MQSTIERPAGHQRSQRLPWICAGGLVLAIALVVVSGALRFATSEPVYQRFTSRPLPDGSRYTFLYPSNLRVIREGGGKPSPGVIANVTLQSSGAVNASPSPWDRLRRRIGVAVPYPGESVTVLVTRLKGPVTQDSPPPRRWADGTGVRQNASVRDTRRRLQFSINHNCFTFTAPQAAAADQLGTHNAVLSQTFEVVPPGAPLPEP
jgi:hypothetical protein